jgi:aspartyl-tRNA(Asn)/glutamyl-tRNA(Gln) amidotransferase subunit B
LMKYAGVSDVDLYQGNMRFDVNISLSKDASQPSTRAEIKNLNSFRSVENAVLYEITRQAELYEKGDKIVQETRGWDEAKQKTTSQRGKEEAHDYRYMPEPDIPPVELDDKFIENIKSQMPALPPEIREILNKLSISQEVVEDIVDRQEIAAAVLRQIEHAGEPSAKRLVYWLLQSKVSSDESLVSEDNRLALKPADVAKLSEMLDKGELNSNAAQVVFQEMLDLSEDPVAISRQKNLIQVSDESEIEEIVQEVLSQNQQAAGDVKYGEMKAIGFLVGQVMAKSQGKANPQLAQQIIKKLLGLN